MLNDVKTSIEQQEIKDLVAHLTNFKQELPSKLEVQCKWWVYFSFYFGWYSIHFNFVC